MTNSEEKLKTQMDLDTQLFGDDMESTSVPSASAEPISPVARSMNQSTFIQPKQSSLKHLKEAQEYGRGAAAAGAAAGGDDDDDSRPLLVNRTGSDGNLRGASAPMARHRRRQNFEKSSFYAKSQTGLSSHAPETESVLSMRHLSEGGRAMRTTDPISSQFNMINMYVGIAIIALPKAVSEVGFVGAVCGLLLVNCLSLISSYFLLKARNRYKKERILDLADLANVCYGPSVKLLCQSILILANVAFLMAQSMYLGGQADLLMCGFLDQPTQCGKHRTFYSFAMLTLMSPILLIPDFKKLSVFSSFFVFCCVVSLIAIFAFEMKAIYGRSIGEMQSVTYSDPDGLIAEATEEEIAGAYNFEIFNFSFFPLYLGEVMCIFEGNVAILNVYSQQSEPRSMFMQTVVTHIFVGFLCILMGLLSYGAYGTLTQDIVLFNLPQGSSMAILVAMLYMFNIIGSVSMTIQPIYCLLEKGTMKGAGGHGPSAPEGDTPVDDLIGADSKSEMTNEDTGEVVEDREHRPDQIVESQEATSYFESAKFIIRRLSIPYIIIMMSTFFPNVNSILSLIGGDICGVMLLILPVFFYNAAYVLRPSKKNRTMQKLVGFGVVAITLPIGFFGLYQNMSKLMAPSELAHH